MIKRELPAPDLADVAYGKHERNVLDFWRAPGPGPRPVVIYFHGGGFRSGDKRSLSPYFLELCLARGVSVAAANYRFAQQAMFPAPMLDGVRAIQFLRTKAAEWNIDLSRIAATGSSAGAVVCFWAGCRDELADPLSPDPVLRQSSRLAAIAVKGAKSTYDINEIRELIGGRAWEHPSLLGLFDFEKEPIDDPEAKKLVDQASPIKLLTRDDPPAFLYYLDPNEPLPTDAKAGQGIHHPRFGAELSRRVQELGIPHVLRHRDEYVASGFAADQIGDAKERDMVDFLARYLRVSSP